MVSGVMCDKQAIIRAIKEKKGVIRHAARKLEIDFDTIYDWMNRDAEVMQAVKDARDLALRAQEDMTHDLVDEAHRAMEYLLKSNDTTAAIFTLKAKAKWAEHKKEHETITGNAKIEIIDYSKAADG